MKKKVLIVDDNKNICEILSTMLEMGGYYAVEIANNGQEAIMLLKKQNFDFLITDFRMPKVNGIEVIRFAKLRDNGIKVVLISGDDISLVEPVARAAGADYVFSKPFNFTKIKQILNSF